MPFQVNHRLLFCSDKIRLSFSGVALIVLIFKQVKKVQEHAHDFSSLPVLIAKQTVTIRNMQRDLAERFPHKNQPVKVRPAPFHKDPIHLTKSLTWRSSIAQRWRSYFLLSCPGIDSRYSRRVFLRKFLSDVAENHRRYTLLSI